GGPRPGLRSRPATGRPRPRSGAAVVLAAAAVRGRLVHVWARLRGEWSGDRAPGRWPGGGDDDGGGLGGARPDPGDELGGRVRPGGDSVAARRRRGDRG